MANGIDDLLGDAKKKGSELWSNIKNSGKEKLKKGITSTEERMEPGRSITKMEKRQNSEGNTKTTDRMGNTPSSTKTTR